MENKHYPYAFGFQVNVAVLISRVGGVGKLIQECKGTN